MKGNKRFISRKFIIFFVVIVTVIGVIVSSNIAYTNMQNVEKMISSYEDKKQKCELLKIIASESITEGVGIDTKVIPSEEIQFRISNKDGSIIFYYCILDDSKPAPKYYATITLTSDYKILKEDYSIEIESFNEYVKSYNYGNRALSMLFVLFICFLICILVLIIYILLQVWFKQKKEKLISNNSSEDKDTMSFMGLKYLIHTWGNGEQVLSAKKLYERVMEDSKSDYRWIAPARELVRICKKTSFPIDYAIDIKIAILNCFANIEHRANCGGDKYRDNPEDLEAVHYCYNSLYELDKEEAISARKYYLAEMIKSASYVHSPFASLYHSGPTYQNLCEHWRISKFEEHISRKEIDFAKLLETLHSDFVDTIKKAEENGDFIEDDTKDEESWQMFYKRMANSFDEDDIKVYTETKQSIRKIPDALLQFIFPLFF